MIKMDAWSVIKKSLGWSTVVTLLFVSSCGCSFRSGHPKKTQYNIHTVPNVSSEEDILIDVICDDSGTLHLVWQSKELGLRYQSSKDNGKSWFDSISIDSEANYSRLDGPQIFSNGNHIFIFWRDRGFNLNSSFDQGQTWSKEPMKFFEEIPIAKYGILADSNTLYFTYNNHKGLFFRRSDNFGLDWTESKRIVYFNGQRTQLSVPSITVWEDGVYLLWSEMDTRSTLPISGFSSNKLFLVCGKERGETWSGPLEIDTDRSHHSNVYEETYSIISPSALAFSDGLLILYEERGLFYKWLNDKVSEETTSEFVSQYPSLNFTLYKGNDSKAYIVWSDARYQEKDWWGYIPAHQILTWDKDSKWANNDLFLAPIQNRKKEEALLLTPALSYVSMNKHAISIDRSEDELYIFWSGREKVGKRVDQYGFPVEIFYRNIKID